MLDRLSRDISTIPPGALRYGLATSLLIVAVFVFNRPQIFEFTLLRQDSSIQDFWAFHAAAQSISIGMVSSLYDAAYFQSLFDGDTGLLWLYPPTMLIFLEPFGGMSYGQAKAIWVLSGIVAFAALVFKSSKNNIVLTVLAVFSPATFSVVYTGQLSVIFAILFAVGLLHSKTHPIVAGLCLGFLSMKPQFGLLVPFFLIFTGAWRAFFWAAVVTVSLIVCSVAFYGIEAWVAFGQSLTNTHMNFVRSPPGNGRIAFLDVLNMAGLSTAMSFGFAGTAIAMSIPMLRSAIRLGADIRALSALTMLLTIVTVPYLWAYEWVFVVLAVVLFLSVKPELENRFSHVIILLVWGVPLLPYIGSSINFALLTWASGAAMALLVYNHIRNQNTETSDNEQFAFGQ